MNYFLDTEFLEGTQKTFFGKSKPTIDLISIGIVCENGNTYYAISKDFNLKDAWNRYDIESYDKQGNILSNPRKVYWIRDNVLLPIYQDFVCGDARNIYDFSYQTMKWILKSIGKSNKQIAKEVKQFVYKNDEVDFCRNDIGGNEHYSYAPLNTSPKFYGYYCDYDWVVFCWMFGKMVNLPQGFPMYCRDLKQILDEKEMARQDGTDMIELRNLPTYPKQTNEHNALSDAKWNFELFNFLQGVS
jgi:hypothetical protein